MTTATGRKVVTFILLKISLKPPYLLWSIFRDRHTGKPLTEKSDLFYFLARMVIRFV